MPHYILQRSTIQTTNDDCASLRPPLLSGLVQIPERFNCRNSASQESAGYVVARSLDQNSNMSYAHLFLKKH